MARKKQTWEGVKISGLADRGKSVGRHSDGRVIFVDGAVPGDVVDVLALRKKKGVWQGVVQGFHKYSPDRTDPPCRHFADCGGCKWQHLDYRAQIHHKQQIVVDVMRRIGKIPTDNIQPILAADPIFHYRNKMEYSFSSQRWKTKGEIESSLEMHDEGGFGLHPQGFFNKVVDITECLLQDPKADALRNHVRAYARRHGLTFWDPLGHHGLLRNMIIRNTAEGDWMVILSFSQPDMEVIHELLKDLLQHFAWVTSLHYVINQKKNDTLFDQKIICFHGKPHIIEKLGDLRFKVRPKSFFQTNTRQAKSLYDVAKKYAVLTGDEVVYDLYTGTGSIALYLAGQAKEVIGIEEVPDAIGDAVDNATLNRIGNAHFYVGDVKQILNSTLVAQHERPDVVITDPPRMGMHEQVVQQILGLAPARLVYISCNPATQARDIALLTKSYEVQRMQPVDMFPHTNHIENVALLTIRKA